jgi:hypothetical protein
MRRRCGGLRFEVGFRRLKIEAPDDKGETGRLAEDYGSGKG